MTNSKDGRKTKSWRQLNFHLLEFYILISHQNNHQSSSVQSLIRVLLFVTPWIAAHQAFLSITNSEFTQTHVHQVSDAIQPSHPLLSPFPPAPNPSQQPESFPMSQLFTWGGQNTGVSALASFLLKKSQGWSPSEWTGWISLQSKGLSEVFSNTDFKSINSSVLSFLHSPTLTSIHDN